MSRVPGVGTTLFVCVLLCSLVLFVCAPGAASQGTDGFDDGETEFRIDLETNGDARIQIIERIPISTDAERAGFDEVAAAFENEEYSLVAVSEFEEASQAVDERTDREMTLSDYEWNATLVETGGDMTGELKVAFTWENFARVKGANNERLHVDDVLVTDQGPWLRGLTERQTLIIGFPDNHGVRNATVSPRGGELRWEGPTTFDEESLRATFIGDGEPNPGGDDGGILSGTPLVVALLAGFLLFIGLAVSFVRFRDRVSEIIGTSGGNSTDSSRDAPSVGDDEHPEDAFAGTGTSSTEDREPAGDEPVIDEELLSDEERVERLLERNGGRMKQADIVDETDWSNAKVSQLLSSMEEAGHIDKLRIGRENLISFPDVELTDSDSEE